MVPNDSTRASAAVSAPSPADHLHGLWQSAPAPDLDAFLAAAGELSPADLVAVLLVDQRQRWRIAQPVPAEAYLQRYPSVRADENGTIDLVYGEFLCRERHGPSPAADEFAWRFPAIAPVLRAQIDLHQALQSARNADAETLPFEHPPTAGASGPRAPGYEILGEVGRGGMGIVYRGRDMRLKRTVALKFLLAGTQAGPGAQARFRTEAEAAARLRHPNIVQVFEVGESDGNPFLVLEYVEGGSLKDALADRPRPARWTAELIRTLAGAVSYAHAQGVLHRDLKPANILLGGDGSDQPKITDFGLAKRTDDGPPADNATRTGDVFGTPSYMSPEQATGRVAEVGPATDVYALGTILYEALTGRPPFHAPDPIRTLQQVAAADPVSPSRLQPGLPRDLVTICLKCLQKEPRKRYATAAALEEDLVRFLAGKPIRARPVGAPERAWRWSRRNPLPAVLGSLVSLLIVVIAVGSVVYALRLREAADEARTSAREQQREAKLAEARAHRFSDRVGRRFAAMDALAAAARIRPGPDLRDEAIAGMGLDDFRLVKSWPLPGGALNRLTFASDFRRYASIDATSGAISVRQVEDDRELYRVQPPAFPGHARFNEVGTLLCVSLGQGEVQVWRLTGGEPVPAVSCDGVAIGSNDMPAVSFSSDGRTFAAARSRGTVVLCDVESERVVKEFPAGRGPIQIAFHPTGRQLAIAGASGVQVRDTGTGRLLVELEADIGSSGVAWHPGGRHLACISDGQMCVWDVVDRRRTTTLEAPLGGGDFVHFGRTGDFLFGQSWSRGLRVWQPWSGAELLRADFPSITWIDAHPDGRLVAVELVDRQVRMLELVRSSARRSLVPVPQSKDDVCYQPAVATAGRARNRLLAVGSSHGVRMFDLATGAEAGRLAIGETRFVAFDRTGALWTNGASGVRRWPVADDPAGHGVTVGPPDRLRPWGNTSQIACSGDGSVVAIAVDDGAVVLRQDGAGAERHLGPHKDVRYLAVSPDGRLVATGSHAGAGVMVWDAATGQEVQHLPVGQATVAFSPDGRWLLTASTEIRLWDCANWSAGPGLGPTNRSKPTFAAFTEDGRTVLVPDGENHLRLHDLSTGRELARFQGRDGDVGYLLAFSQDGRWAFTSLSHLTGVAAWDLTAVGRELAAVGLPWEVEPWPDLDPTPLRVNVTGPDAESDKREQLAAADSRVAQVTKPGGTPDPPAAQAAAYAARGRARMALHLFGEAVEDFDRAIELAPGPGHYANRAQCRSRAGDAAGAVADLRAALKTASGEFEARLCNNLAWLMVTGPASVRDPAEAATLAARASNLAPTNLTFVNTLGVALYRSGRLQEAVNTLRRSLRGGEDPAHDLYFLAMCYHGLSEPTKSQEAFDQAEYWMSLHANALPPALRAELNATREEATANRTKK